MVTLLKNFRSYGRGFFTFSRLNISLLIIDTHLLDRLLIFFFKIDDDFERFFLWDWWWLTYLTVPRYTQNPKNECNIFFFTLVIILGYSLG